MNKQDRKYLKRLLETPSPTGCEQRIAAIVRERMEGVAAQLFCDAGVTVLDESQVHKLDVALGALRDRKAADS